MKDTNLRMIDTPDFQNALRRILEEMIPFCRVLGIRLASFDPENPQLEFAMRDELLGNVGKGMLHGGAIAAVLDTMAGYAIFLKMTQEDPKPDLMAQLQEFARMSTIDLRVDYLQPGRGERFTASATVTRLGRRVANVQMALRNEEGVCIATGAAAFMLHAPKSGAG
ncbi:MAG TPA: thioesterase family protein [Noviherbaspirillum sp.]|nr:thioesterase family protein [Noviherbaspirillum sp.]